MVAVTALSAASMSLDVNCASVWTECTRTRTGSPLELDFRQVICATLKTVSGHVASVRAAPWRHGGRGGWLRERRQCGQTPLPHSEELH